MKTQRHLVLLLAAAAIFYGTPAPVAAETWEGTSVLPTKRPKDIPFMDKVDGKDVSYRYSGQWPLKVRAEKNGQIRIHDGYHEGWVAKSDFVPVKDAPAYFDKRVQAVPTDAWAWNMRGNGWSEKKEYDKAIQDLDEAIRLDPSEPIYFNNRGFAYLNKKDHDKAITNLDEAIRLDPKYALAYSNRGAAWNGKKESDKAIRDCDEAIRLRPDFTWPRRHRGEALMLKKDYDAALKDFDEAIERDPKFAVAHYDKAACLAVKNRPDAALESLQRALELGFRNFERMKKDQALDSIRNESAYQKLLKQYDK
jgi:tetratricopeptide (TPR) repeat protein